MNFKDLFLHMKSEFFICFQVIKEEEEGNLIKFSKLLYLSK